VVAVTGRRRVLLNARYAPIATKVRKIDAVVYEVRKEVAKVALENAASRRSANRADDIRPCRAEPMQGSVG